jgi:hypothetical protein
LIHSYTIKHHNRKHCSIHFNLPLVFDVRENTYNNLKDAVPESGQARTVRIGDEWILAFNPSTQDSDVVDNLKDVLAGLDIEDIRYIDSLVLIGSKKSVRVDSNLVEDLVGDRTSSPVIINGIKDELNPDFGYKLYERGPHRRLAIRLPIYQIKDFNDKYTARIKQILLKDGSMTPDTVGDILSVYLIADETYVRLEPEIFFQEIFGLKEDAGTKTPEPSGNIILGESPGELVELALNKLKKHTVYRDIRFVEAAGLVYSFDALAALEDERILIKYVDKLTDEDMISMKLFLEALNAKSGWILTREPFGDEKPVRQWKTENISILTIKEL